MQLSEATSTLLSTLHSFSDGKLSRSNDLGLLIELANRHSREVLLNELSFYAKFISRTYRIMQRIGIQGEGYDRLSREFTDAIEKSKSLITTLLTDSPTEDRQRFTSAYLKMTPESFQHLLALCYDLSWYKNWMIDRAKRE